MVSQRLSLPVVLVIGLYAPSTGCVEVPASGSDVGDVGDSDAHLFDATPADAGVDARLPRPDVTVYDFCDQAVFKLPIDGMTEITRGIDIWGSRLAYSKYPVDDEDQMNVFIFDIGQCSSHQLTYGARSRAAGPNLWNETVVWSDSRSFSTEPYQCNELFSYDLEMWSELQLTDDSVCKRSPKTNGRYLVYTRNIEPRNEAASDFRLRDFETDEELVLAPAWGQVGYFDISDRYVVWSQYRGVTSSKGRDIVYYDLEAGEMGWVAQSAEHYTYAVFTSGDHLTYLASGEYAMPPWSLHLYNLVSGDATVLSDDDDAMPYGFIAGNLVTWNTAIFAEPHDMGLFDNMIYDIRSGLSRRLTSRSSNMGIGEIGFPYVILGQWLGVSQSNHSDYYIANLVELGVTDLDGNLIPGDPVLDPPPDGP